MKATSSKHGNFIEHNHYIRLYTVSLTWVLYTGWKLDQLNSHFHFQGKRIYGLTHCTRKTHIKAEK